MRLIKLTLFILFNSVVVIVFGQTESCQKSTEGTDFWFGFMEGRTYNTGHYTEITLTSSYTCNYKYYIGKSTIPVSGTLFPNTPLKIQIDWHLVEVTGSETTQEKAIHLTSDNPLNVYALNWSPSSSEIALIFPTKSLGNEYYAMCYTPHVNGNNITSGNGRNSEFLIVASEDQTLVTITPSKVTDQNKPANIPFQITLNKGEAYQVQSENLLIPKWPGQGDLTGSYIKSDKPVALYSGSLSTTIPNGSSVSAWDHLYEQMPPMQTWGRKFITVPLKSRHEDTYRILAAEDNTTVRIGSKTPVTLMKGTYYEFSLLYTEASLIESDKPILLAQFSNSNSVDATFTNKDGDPFMVILSPVNQTREKVAFVAYDSPQITSKFFINVVVKDDAIGAIKLDNVIVAFVSIAGTGYSYAQIPLVKGNHYIESTVPGKGFIAYVYGFGGVEAYGYGVGYNLDIVLDLGSNINASGDKLLVRCDGSPSLTLNAGNAFDNYLWSTGETTSAIQVVNAGWYYVKASIAGGCELTDSVEVQVSKPAVFLGRDTLICNPANIVLDAGDQFTNFSWSTPQGSLAGQMISASKAGIYTVEAINKYGCKARDTIKVSFADKPRLDLMRLDTLMCGKYTTTVDISADKTVSWLLESSNPKLNINNLTASVLPSDEGTYPVILTAKDTFSCVATTTFNLGFFQSPVVNLGRDTTVCNPENIKLNAGAGFASYLWSTAETTPEIILHNEGVYNVNIVASNGCKARDTMKVSFADRPRLDLSRLDTLMCGKYTTTVDISADKTVSWLMECNNPKLNISNLNASVLPADEGTYPVILTAKDTFSCVATTAFNLGFFKSPVVNLGRDTTVCNPENIKLNAGAGFAGYLWSTSETTPDITLQKAGLYSVNIIASNGCKAGDTMKVSFTDRPKIDLSNLESLICGKFETALNVSSDKKVVWLVNSDSKVKFNGLSAKVLPADFGTYPVFLTAKDTFSCKSDTTFKLGFYKIPKVDFTTDAKKCSGYNLLAKYAGDADTIVSNFKWVFRGDLIANQSGLNSLLVPLGINRLQRDLELTVTQDGCSDSVSRNIIVTPKLFLSDVVKLGCEPFNAVFKATNTEVVDYFWNFGDGSSVEKGDSIISHIYQKSNFYNVKLKVVTKEGCTNEIAIDSLVYAAPIPTSGFTPLSAECLSKGNHEISYLGSADQLDTYHWDLSKLDSEEVIRNPAMAQGPLIFNLKNKPQAKIKLSVVSKFGCPSDTAMVLVKRIPDFVMSASSYAGCTPFEPLFKAITADSVDQVNYNWSFGDNVTGTGKQIKHIYGVPDHKYDVMLAALSATTGCADTISRKEYMWTYPIPTAGFTQFQVECLDSGNHEISYLGTGDQLDSYRWDLSNFDGEEVIRNPASTQGPLIFNLKNKPQTTIKLSVVSKYGCYSDTASVLVKRKPSFSVDVSPNAGCTPLESLFKGTVKDAVDQLNYSWNFGDGTKGTGAQAKHSYDVPDHKYDIILTALSSITGCSDTLDRKELVWAYPKPTALFSMDNKIVYNDKPTINFSNASIGASTYVWDFGDGLTSGQKDATHDYKATGYRTVILEVFNDQLCSDTVSHQILVAFDRIFPPNAFSPNAPDAIDREYKLGSEGIAAEGYHLVIMSRWNDIVFEAKNEIKGWNGQMHDSSFAPAGAYVWVLDFTDFLGRRHRQTGTVTLVY